MLERPPVSAIVVSLAVVWCAACGKKPGAGADATAAASAASAAASAPAAAATPLPSAAPGSPVLDGKYENVTVDGVAVPMIEVMNHGTIVLVDTDGKKPRTWEEQYKRKHDLPAGQFDIHKTNTNKNDTFEDDPIDREGLWVIDATASITKRTPR